MRIAVLCSGNGSNFENIVRTCKNDEVVLMIHNKLKCGAAKRADKFGIPHSYIDSTDEINMIRLIQAWNVDLIVLAGWMRIVTKDFIDAFRGRIINVHPSLLPKYKGLHAVQQAMDAGETETGATVHYVNENLMVVKSSSSLKYPFYIMTTLNHSRKPYRDVSTQSYQRLLNMLSQNYRNRIVDIC